MLRIFSILFVLSIPETAYSQHSVGRWPFPNGYLPAPVNAMEADHRAWCDQENGSWSYRICTTSDAVYEFAYQRGKVRYVKMRVRQQMTSVTAEEWISVMSVLTSRAPSHDVDPGYGVRIVHWDVASPSGSPWVVAMFYNEIDHQMTLMVMTWREWNIEEWD